MENKINELMNLKEEVEGLKVEKAKLEGKHEEFEDFFEKELSIKDLDKIEKELSIKEKEIEELKYEFNVKYDDLINKLNENK